MKRYRIGTFSKRCGVSADTLRYYEKAQLIHPQHDEANEYRLYSDENMIELMQTRMLRSMHIPIKSLQENRGKHSLALLHQDLCQQCNHLDQEIAQLTKKLNRIKMLRRELEECQSQVGICKNVVYPPMYCLFFEKDEPDSKSAQLIKAWSAQFPYIHLSFRIPEKELQSPPGMPMQAEIGLGVLKEYADEIGLPHAAPAHATKVSAGVRCLLRVADPLHPTIENFAPLIRYLRETGQTPVGPWHYRLRFMEQLPDGSSCAYIAMRVYTESCSAAAE